MKNLKIVVMVLLVMIPVLGASGADDNSFPVNGRVRIQYATPEGYLSGRVINCLVNPDPTAFVELNDEGVNVGYNPLVGFMYPADNGFSGGPTMSMDCSQQIPDLATGWPTDQISTITVEDLAVTCPSTALIPSELTGCTYLSQ